MDTFASDTDRIAAELIKGGMDQETAMRAALRLSQSRQQANGSILGGIPTQPAMSDIPPVEEPILGGDPSRLFRREPTVKDRIKSLPQDVIGAGEALMSLGSAAALTPASMLYALRPGQKTQGAPFEFATRNMYLPRTESGIRHLEGLGEVLEQLPQTGPLPELQAFAGMTRGMGTQAAQKAREARAALAPAVAQGAEDLLRRQGLIMDVVKPKGGNIVGGNVRESIDQQLGALKSRGPTEEDRQWLIEHAKQNPEASRRGLEEIAKTEAINNWIGRNLSNYIKKEMGTPDDPVRKLAETGVTHLNRPYEIDQNFTMRSLPSKREEEGFPASGLAQSPQARSWENLSDRAIDVYTAGEIQPQAAKLAELQKLDERISKEKKEIHERIAKEILERGRSKGWTEKESLRVVEHQLAYLKWKDPNFEIEYASPEYVELLKEFHLKRKQLDDQLYGIARENPWIDKLPPEAKIYAVETGDLGFDHVIDVLRDDVEAGRIRPEQLSKVSVADAVRRTYEFDQEMAKKASKAQDELASKLLRENPFRTYSNGYRWVQLPDPAKSDENLKLVKDIGCQGGWCTQKDVNALYYGAHEDGNNLYVLMSPDNKVHAQIHVQLPDRPYDFDALMADPKTKAQAGQAVREWRQRNPQVNAPLEDEQVYQALREAGIPEQPASISEIKPRANSWSSQMVADQVEKDPNYKDTIQRMLGDFVKSRQWKSVDDFQNTGLVRLGSQWMYESEAEKLVRPQIDEALQFLKSEPSLQPFREAQKKRDEFRGDISSPQYTQIQHEAGRPISQSIPYTYAELKAILSDPGAYADRDESIYASALRAIENINKYKSELAEKKASPTKATGGAVSKQQMQAAAKEIAKKYAKGGAVMMSGGGGLAKTVQAGAKAAKTAAAEASKMRAQAGKKVGDIIAEIEPEKFSEALGKQNIEGTGIVKVTQADRTRVGGPSNNIGGSMFSALQLYDPFYKQAGATWGVGKKSTAQALINQSTPETLWTTLLGSEDQLKSNPIVFDQLFKAFNKGVKEGRLTPELRNKINTKLEPLFGEGADILDPKIRQLADTFEKRALLADLLLGKQIGGELRGGSIIPGTEILKRETEPLLLHPAHGGDVPTFSVGPRLFQLSGEVMNRPDLHPGFPVILGGKDLGVTYKPVPGDIAMRDFVQRMKKERGRVPGYYEWTMGEKGRGLPSQLVTDEYLTYLQKEGFKSGGLAKTASTAAKAAKKAKSAKYADPKTEYLEDWRWRPMEDVEKELQLVEVPDYIQQGYGEFMKEQLERAKAGEISPRDLIKAYTITQSSIGRGGLPYTTATKTGMKLPRTETEVRPEGAFAEWLGSRMGQKYLDAAERGELSTEAIEELRQFFAPFGKQNEQAEAMKYAANVIPPMKERISGAITGSPDEYRDFAESLRGVATAKSGFVGSMLGRGDLPTFDARQVNLHTAGMPSPTASPLSVLKRGKGQAGREAVDRLAARQRLLELGLDPNLEPFYQHLAHHAVWDKLGGTKTTHEDIVRAMRGYSHGGLSKTAKKAKDK